MARITIPYAVADFIDLRERNFYYVDKTDFIPGLEEYNAPVFLRPPRFEELFCGTWIGEHPTKEHNRYMIVRYDFSAMVMADDMEGMEMLGGDFVISFQLLY